MANFNNKDVVDGVDPALFTTETDITAMEFVGRPSNANRKMTGAQVVSEVVTKSDLGTFTGATIEDNRNIKEALQDLETALEEIEDAEDTNTTYGISAETVSGGANLRLTGSDGSTDDVKIEAGDNVTVERVDANTVRVSSTASGGQAYTEIYQDKASILGVSGQVTYTKPATLGAVGALVLSTWASLKRIAILIDKDVDYDNAGNDFVLTITVGTTTSNDWNPAGGTTGFDLIKPDIEVWNGAPSTVGSSELYVYDNAAVAQDNTPSAMSWNANVLTLRFGGKNFKANSRNIIFLSV
jgi:hypothetical protein